MGWISENAGNNRKRLAAVVDERRAHVAALKVEGRSARAIVAALERDGVRSPTTGKPWGLATVLRDLAALEARWRAEAASATGEWKARELARLDEVERQAWASWGRSIGQHETTYRERRDGKAAGGKVAVRVEVSNGDPRFLSTIIECSRRRAELLGLDAPKKTAATAPDGSAPLPERVEVVLVRPEAPVAQPP